VLLPSRGQLTWLVERLPGAHTFSLTECVVEFSSLMTAQLDLRVEAANLARLRRNFHVDGAAAKGRGPADARAKVTFPAPLPALTTESVLVEAYAEGRLISDMLAGEELRDPALRRDVAVQVTPSPS
jgi:hypothetical protein